MFQPCEGLFVAGETFAAIELRAALDPPRCIMALHHRWPTIAPSICACATRSPRRSSTGAMPKGDMLPSVRAFAAEQGANPLTVAKAYQQFQTDGLIRVQRGVGMFVREGAAEQLRSGGARAVPRAGMAADPRAHGRGSASIRRTCSTPPDAARQARHCPKMSCNQLLSASRDCARAGTLPNWRRVVMAVPEGPGRPQ